MTTFQKLYSSIDNTPEYVAAGLQIDVAVSVDSIMKKRDMSNADLAAKLECSRAYVTKILRGDSNFSILPLSKLACALHSDLKIQMVPR